MPWWFHPLNLACPKNLDTSGLNPNSRNRIVILFGSDIQTDPIRDKFWIAQYSSHRWAAWVYMYLQKVSSGSSATIPWVIRHGRVDLFIPSITQTAPDLFEKWLSLPFNTHLDLRYWYLMPLNHHMGHQKNYLSSQPIILVHESWLPDSNTGGTSTRSQML